MIKPLGKRGNKLLGLWKKTSGTCVYEAPDYCLCQQNIILNYNTVLFPLDKINEGLITAYSAESSEKYLKQIFPNIVCINNYHTGVNKKLPDKFKCVDYNNMQIKFAITISKYYDNIKDISQKVYDLCGWFPYVIRVRFSDAEGLRIPISVCISYDNFFDKTSWDDTFTEYAKHCNIECMEIYYLSKFGYIGSLPEYIFKKHYLYHTTRFEHVRKISEIGLCPRKKSSNTLSRYCIYFSDNIDTLIRMMNKDNSQINVLLRFSGNYINSKNCQYDEKHSGAYFTTTNIPPDILEVYTERGWVDIRDCVNNMYNMKTMDEIIKECL